MVGERQGTLRPLRCHRHVRHGRREDRLQQNGGPCMRRVRGSNFFGIGQRPVRRLRRRQVVGSEFDYLYQLHFGQVRCGGKWRFRGKLCRLPEGLFRVRPGIGVHYMRCELHVRRGRREDRLRSRLGHCLQWSDPALCRRNVVLGNRQRTVCSVCGRLHVRRGRREDNVQHNGGHRVR